MKKIAVHSLLLLIILGSGRLQAVAGPADKIRKNIELLLSAKTQKGINIPPEAL